MQNSAIIGAVKNRGESSGGASSERRKRLVVIGLLILFVVLGYFFILRGAAVEKPRVTVPLDDALDAETKRSEDAREIVELANTYYWNAWIGEHAWREGNFSGAFLLFTKEYRDIVRRDAELQDAITIGKSAGKVDIEFLRDDSRLFGLQIGEEGIAVVQADVAILVRPTDGEDHVLHQSVVFNCMKEGEKWRIDSITIIVAREQPSKYLSD